MSRWAPLTGVVFVALWIPAFTLLAGGPENPSDAEIVAYYADDANRGQDATSFFLIAAASLVFVGFLAVLRDRMARGVDRAGSLTTFAFGGGLAAATLWIVAGVFWMAIAYTENETTEFVLDPDTERLVSEMAYLLFVTGTYATIPVVLGTSVSALRTGVLPKWLGWLGVVVAVSLLGALGVFPFFLFLGWVLLLSVVFLARTGEAAAQPGREVRVP